MTNTDDSQATPPPSDSDDSGASPAKRVWGPLEWGLLAVVVGLVVYRVFFPGPC